VAEPGILESLFWAIGRRSRPFYRLVRRRPSSRYLPLTSAKVTFAPRDSAQFVRELKERVTADFAARGVGQKANWQMILKTIIMLGGTVGCYGLILSNHFTPWQMLGLAILMGVGVAGIGFSVSHDALHGAYSSNPKVNALLGLTFDMCGANGYMWKITHNVIHHTYTNIHGVDEDLTVSPLLRLSPNAPHRPINRLQWLFAFPAYSLSTLFWVFVKDFKYFRQRHLGPYQEVSHPKREIAILFITKLLYFTYAIVVPLLVLNLAWWQFVIGFLAMQLTAGLILGVVFQLAHVVEETTHPLPDSQGLMEHSWIVHEMETTSDFATGNRLLSWYVGGLNHQIEHHLFPKVCHVHYRRISGIVREVAAKYQIRYNHHDTLSQAIGSHFSMLRKLAKADAQPHQGLSGVPV
jgi:linoleoyl-CoA desaturase